MPAYRQEDLKLPRKFAEQVLELEMDVDNNVFSLNQIQRLMALYSKAVEFYNGKSDSKYLYFQDKMQDLISQPKVLDMLSSKTAAEVDDTKKNEKPVPKADPKVKEQLKKKERILKMNLHMSNKEMEKKDVKSKMIEDMASTKDKESKIIDTDLSDQTNNFQRRLEERKLKMKQKKDEEEKKEKEEENSHLTNSSTPNQTLSSKKEHEDEDKQVSKSRSSGTNSLGEACTFQFNLDGLQDDKFSGELMNRLKILGEGYDDDDYDDDDLFDEEKVENEIEQILNKCDEEVEKILEEDRNQVEDLFERIANDKFEKLAEIKAEYKYRLKFTESEEEKLQISEELKTMLDETNLEFAKLKEEQMKELKSKQKENKDKIKIKRDGIKQVANRVRRSVSRKASRRASGRASPQSFKAKDEPQSNFTNIMPIRNKEQLQEDLSKGIKSNKDNKGLQMPKGPVRISPFSGINLVDNNEDSS